MPKELIATAPPTPVLRDYEEPPLPAGQVRIRTEFASPKHGTELVGYRDDPAAHRPYDREWGAVLPTPGGVGERIPRPLGNMGVGVVTEIGAGVTRFTVGDRVFGHLPIRETHTVDEGRVDSLPDGLSTEAAVCLDPVVMALPIRDAGISLGDRVAVFGMGAIGLFAIQLARLAGADQVIAVDPLPDRRALALKLGADHAIDPLADGGDAGLAIRWLTHPDATGQPSEKRPLGEHIVGGYRERQTQFTDLGVDVAVEASGNVRALHETIRATRYGGTVCVLSFYGGDSPGLRLGEEFHMNRINLISARAESLPLRDAPGWNLTRLVETSLAWLVSGRLKADGIITPIVSFADAVEAYRAIDERPHESIKRGISFP